MTTDEAKAHLEDAGRDIAQARALVRRAMKRLHLVSRGAAGDAGGAALGGTLDLRDADRHLVAASEKVGGPLRQIDEFKASTYTD